VPQKLDNGFAPGDSGGNEGREGSYPRAQQATGRKTASAKYFTTTKVSLMKFLNEPTVVYRKNFC